MPCVLKMFVHHLRTTKVLILVKSSEEKKERYEYITHARSYKNGMISDLANILSLNFCASYIGVVRNQVSISTSKESRQHTFSALKALDKI